MRMIAAQVLYVLVAWFCTLHQALLNASIDSLNVFIIKFSKFAIPCLYLLVCQQTSL